jgi:hypothetical protein
MLPALRLIGQYKSRVVYRKEIEDENHELTWQMEIQ